VISDSRLYTLLTCLPKRPLLRFSLASRGTNVQKKFIVLSFFYNKTDLLAFLYRFSNCCIMNVRTDSEVMVGGDFVKEQILNVKNR